MKKAYDLKDRDALLKIADEIAAQVLPSLISLHELHRELMPEMVYCVIRLRGLSVSGNPD
jgi:hypothetical protein